MPSAETDHEAVGAVVEGLRQGFGGPDAGRLKQLWAGDGDLRYVASERSRPLRTREEIERYYDDAVGPVAAVDAAEITDLTVDVSGELGYASYRFRYDGRASGEDSRFSVDVRSTVILRKTNGRWGIVHYHESTPGQL